MSGSRTIKILALAVVAAVVARSSPAAAAGNWHWGTPGIYRGMDPTTKAHHVIQDGIADPNTDYWTPFWERGNAPNKELGAGAIDKGFRNEFAVNHDINAQAGLPVIGYLDVVTPLFHTNELEIASTVSTIWNNIRDTVSSMWSSVTSLFTGGYNDYQTYGNFSYSGWGDNGFIPSFTGYDSGGGGGAGCFVAGTPVTMADGSTRPIESIRDGDLVLAYDTKSGKPEVSKVTRTVVHDHWKERADTVLINGTLRATVNHPFFANGKWRRADQLKVGDTLVRALPTRKDTGAVVRATSVLGDGAAAEPAPLPSIDTVTVKSIQRMPGADVVYNLEVEKYHDFFSGGVLVHNLIITQCF
jgi:hypothetical protein